MNAVIFQGFSPNNLEEISEVIKCKPPNGTKIGDFSKFACSLGFTRIYKPTLEKLNSLLDLGNAVIINHGDKKRRHYSLIISRTPGAYSIVNHYCGATITPIKVAKFISDVWRDPKIWIVKA